MIFTRRVYRFSVVLISPGLWPPKPNARKT